MLDCLKNVFLVSYEMTYLCRVVMGMLEFTKAAATVMMCDDATFWLLCWWFLVITMMMMTIAVILY